MPATNLAVLDGVRSGESHARTARFAHFLCSRLAPAHLPPVVADGVLETHIRGGWTCELMEDFPLRVRLDEVFPRRGSRFTSVQQAALVLDLTRSQESP